MLVHARCLRASVKKAAPGQPKARAAPKLRVSASNGGLGFSLGFRALGLVFRSQGRFRAGSRLDAKKASKARKPLRVAVCIKSSRSFMVQALGNAKGI